MIIIFTKSSSSFDLPQNPKTPWVDLIWLKRNKKIIIFLCVVSVKKWKVKLIDFVRFLVSWRMRSKKLLFCQVWQLLVTCCFRLFLVLFPLFSTLLPLLSSTAENRFFRWGSEERKGCVFCKRWIPRSWLVEGSSELPAKGRKPAPTVVVQRVYPWQVRQQSQVC